MLKVNIKKLSKKIMKRVLPLLICLAMVSVDVLPGFAEGVNSNYSEEREMYESEEEAVVEEVSTPEEREMYESEEEAVVEEVSTPEERETYESEEEAVVEEESTPEEIEEDSNFDETKENIDDEVLGTPSEIEESEKEEVEEKVLCTICNSEAECKDKAQGIYYCKECDKTFSKEGLETNNTSILNQLKKMSMKFLGATNTVSENEKIEMGSGNDPEGELVYEAQGTIVFHLGEGEIYIDEDGNEHNNITWIKEKVQPEGSNGYCDTFIIPNVPILKKDGCFFAGWRTRDTSDEDFFREVKTQYYFIGSYDIAKKGRISYPYCVYYPNPSIINKNHANLYPVWRNESEKVRVMYHHYSTKFTSEESLLAINEHDTFGESFNVSIGSDFTYEMKSLKKFEKFTTLDGTQCGKLTKELLALHGGYNRGERCFMIKILAHFENEGALFAFGDGHMEGSEATYYEGKVTKTDSGYILNDIPIIKQNDCVFFGWYQIEEGEDFYYNTSFDWSSAYVFPSEINRKIDYFTMPIFYPIWIRSEDFYKNIEVHYIHDNKDFCNEVLNGEKETIVADMKLKQDLHGFICPKKDLPHCACSEWKCLGLYEKNNEEMADIVKCDYVMYDPATKKFIYNVYVKWEKRSKDIIFPPKEINKNANMYAEIVESEEEFNKKSIHENKNFFHFVAVEHYRKEYYKVYSIKSQTLSEVPIDLGDVFPYEGYEGVSRIVVYHNSLDDILNEAIKLESKNEEKVKEIFKSNNHYTINYLGTEIVRFRTKQYTITASVDDDYEYFVLPKNGSIKTYTINQETISPGTNYNLNNYKGEEIYIEWQGDYLKSNSLIDLLKANGRMWLNFIVEPVAYKISFDARDGKISNNKESYDINYGEYFDGSSIAATKKGYNFKGWSTNDKAKEGENIGNFEVTKDQVFYAIWEPIKYNIIFNIKDKKDAFQNIIKEYDKALDITELPIPEEEIEHYNFDGWYKDSNCTTNCSLDDINKDSLFTNNNTEKVHVYGQYKPERIELTFIFNGGSIEGLTSTENSSIIEGYYDMCFAEIHNCPTLKRYGYTFIGWSTTNDAKNIIDKYEHTVTSNENYYAIWKPNKYLIYCNTSDGTTEIYKTYGIFDEEILPSPKSKGYVYIWYKDSTYTDPPISTNGKYLTTDDLYSETCALNIYGNPVPKKYNITFDFNGGHNKSDQSKEQYIANNLDFDSKIETIPEPVRFGYNLKCWSANLNGTKLIDFKTYKVAGDETFYAIWEAREYTIKFYIDGSEVTSYKTTKTYGDSLTLPNPEKSGHTFDGWYGNFSCDGENYNKLSDQLYTNNTITEITLYGKYVPIEYTIRHDLKGGTTVGGNTSLGDKAKTYGEEYIPPEMNNKLGYTFIGWYYKLNDDEEEHEYNEDEDILSEPGEVTIYPKWQPVSYTIKYHISYKNNIKSATNSIQEYTYSNESSLLEPETVTGYTFDGWYKDSNCAENSKYNGNADDLYKTLVGATMDLYGKYVPGKHNITFDFNGGHNKLDQSMVEYIVNNLDFDSKIETIPTPVRLGYDLIGWSTNSDKTKQIDFDTYTVAGDETFYAIWEAREYTIKFYINGSEVTSYERSKTYGDSLTLPTPEKLGHTFDGWYKNLSCDGEKYDADNISNDKLYTNNDITEINVYGKYVPIEYTIRHDLKGGTTVGGNTSLGDKAKTYGEEYIPPEMNDKTGYTFIGWYYKLNDEEEEHEYNEDEDILSKPGEVTIYPKWEAREYTIKFYINGSEVTSYKTTKTYGDSLTLPNPEKLGHTFDGWYTNSECSSEKYDADNISNDKLYTNNDITEINVYGKYVPIEYTIRHDLKGGTTENNETSLGDITKTYGEEYIPPEMNDKTGYTFIGWYYKLNDEEEEHEYNEDEDILSKPGEVTIYPKWEAIKYTIKHNTNKGNTIDDYTKTYGETYTPPIPVKLGFKFVGWYEDDTFEKEYNEKRDLLTTNGSVVTIYAKWVQLVTIKLHFNGGKVVDGDKMYTKTVEINTKFTLPSESSLNLENGENALFGWSDILLEPTTAKGINNTTYRKVGASITVDRDINLYAVWVKPATVTLDFNGGYILLLSKKLTKTVKIGTEFTIKSTYGIIKSGYKLTGWSTKKVSPDIATDEDIDYNTNLKITVKDDMTLYAVWQIKYLTDLRIANNYAKNSNGLKYDKQKLIDDGFTILSDIDTDESDLNRNAKGADIFLGYKTTTNKNNAITDILATDSWKGNTMTYNKITYNLCYVGTGLDFCDQKNRADLNDEAKGWDIYIYYTKDKAAGDPIKSKNFKMYNNKKDTKSNPFGNSNKTISRIINGSERRRMEFNSSTKKKGNYIYISFRP